MSDRYAMTDDETREFRAMCARAASWSAIMARFGKSLYVVQTIARRLGINKPDSRPIVGRQRRRQAMCKAPITAVLPENEVAALYAGRRYEDCPRAARPEPLLRAVVTATHLPLY